LLCCEKRLCLFCSTLVQDWSTRVIKGLTIVLIRRRRSIFALFYRTVINQIAYEKNAKQIYMHILKYKKHICIRNHPSKVSFIPSKKWLQSGYHYYYYARFLDFYWLSAIDKSWHRLAQNPQKKMILTLIPFLIAKNSRHAKIKLIEFAHN
jgi:hypothetical protein